MGFAPAQPILRSWHGSTRKKSLGWGHPRLLNRSMDGWKECFRAISPFATTFETSNACRDFSSLRRRSELVADTATHDVGGQPVEREVEALALELGPAGVVGVECERRAAEVIVQIFDAQHEACIPQLPLGAGARDPAEVI